MVLKLNTLHRAGSPDFVVPAMYTEMAPIVRSPAEGKGTEGYLLPETLISRPSNRKRGPTKDGEEGICKVGFRFESYMWSAKLIDQAKLTS